MLLYIALDRQLRQYKMSINAVRSWNKSSILQENTTQAEVGEEDGSNRYSSEDCLRRSNNTIMQSSHRTKQTEHPRMRETSRLMAKTYQIGRVRGRAKYTHGDQTQWASTVAAKYRTRRSDYIAKSWGRQLPHKQQKVLQGTLMGTLNSEKTDNIRNAATRWVQTTIVNNANIRQFEQAIRRRCSVTLSVTLYSYAMPRRFRSEGSVPKCPPKAQEQFI